MQLALEDVQEIRFTVVKGSNPGSKIAFEPIPRTVRIGRSADNDIVVADPTVSRQHARVEILANGYTIVDCGSAGGVEKMGFRIGSQPEPLLPGDEFKLGDTILGFEVVAKKGARQRAAAREAGVAPRPSPITNVVAVLRRALATMGLRTPLLQGVGAACFLALIAVGLWPAPPTIPPQAFGAVPIDYNAVWGYKVGDSSHADGVVVDLPMDSEGVGLYARIAAGDGVEIRAGDRVVATLERGREFEGHHVLVLPRAIARDGKAHIIIDHRGYAAEQGAVSPDAVAMWGVGRMWAVRVPEAPSSPARLADDVTALGALHAGVEADPGIRYNLVTGMRTAMVGLMKLAGRPAVAFPLPLSSDVQFESQVQSAVLEIRERRFDRAVDRLLPAVQLVDIELNREYVKFRNKLTVLQKNKGAEREIALVLPNILKLIPDPTDHRHREALEASRKLKRKALEEFEDLMETR